MCIDHCGGDSVRLPLAKRFEGNSLERANLSPSVMVHEVIDVNGFPLFDQ